MLAVTVTELVPALQTAIIPAILISGTGLVLLTMTNRLGRAIDRARQLRAKLPEIASEKQAGIRAQLDILWRRALKIRIAILFASVSALLGAFLIVFLFLANLFQFDGAPWSALLFSACVAALIVSLLLFIHDINQSLAALKLELEDSP